MSDVREDWLEHNRENWDDRVAVHAASEYYDLAGFRAGAQTLRDFEIEELGGVEGRSLLHLQCHMGQDTLSWARLGARVTGLDFSAEAITRARSLAADTGLADRASFVVSDVYAADTALAGERFDIVYTGIGALVWLPDLTRWAQIVASLLAEGGVLYLVEFHPLLDLLGEDGRSVEHDYFDTAGEVLDYSHTYTDGPALSSTLQVQWRHPLGEVITALAAAGLVIQRLNEHPFIMFERFPGLVRVGPQEYRYPDGQPGVPLMYSLRAVRPGAR